MEISAEDFSVIVSSGNAVMSEIVEKVEEDLVFLNSQTNFDSPLFGKFESDAHRDEQILSERLETSADEDESYCLFPIRNVADTQEQDKQTMAPIRAQSAPLPMPYRVAGNAIDIIAVKSKENHYYTTSWHVMFSWSRFRSRNAAGVGDEIKIFINGIAIPAKMQLLERGRCVFDSGSLVPSMTALDHVDLRTDGPNHVRFEHFHKSSYSMRYVECRLYVWGTEESVIVADLDGTLTISDVEGHIRTLRLGQYDYLHKGTCHFFTKLCEIGLKIMYLTARPLDWATASRTHLENAAQIAHTLPLGPLITSTNGLTGALLTEVINKNPHVFKLQMLEEIQLCLIHAGRTTQHPIFVAGFGNRPSDVLAYKDVGIELDSIFLIDSTSLIKCGDTTLTAKHYDSYDDPNVLLWLLPRLKHRVPLEKVWKIDEYTMQELFLAEEREQLLLSERRARILEQKENERARELSRKHSSKSLI